MTSPDVLNALRGSAVRISQSQMAGYNGIAGVLPADVAFCNVAGVHETATGELALALTLAVLRGIPHAVTAQTRGSCEHARFGGLADKRVLIIGYGGVGREVHRRIIPFDVQVTRVARSERTDEHGIVHGMASLPALLGQADVVIVAVPLDDETRGLVDAGFLARLSDGALLVNVSRGPIVVTDDLVVELRSERIQAARDVTDPEPLPAGHPLCSMPGTLVTPHVGRDTDAMDSRIVALIKRQVDRLLAGDAPLNQINFPAQGSQLAGNAAW